MRGVRRPTVIAIWVLAVTAPQAVALPTIDDARIGPTGWNATDRADIAWVTHGATPFASGIRFEVNTAPDGSADGSWTVISTVSPLVAATGAVSNVSLGGLEGRHAARAVAWDRDGEAVRYLGTILLDHSAPHATQASVLARSPQRTTYRWIQEDPGGSGTAPGSVSVDLEVSPGVWLASPQVGADGLREAVLDAGALPDGRYAVRVTSRDVAGNAGASELPTLFVDHSPPVISDLTVAQAPVPGRPAVRLDYVAGDAVSGIDAGTAASVVDVERGTILAEAPSGPGPQSVWVELLTASPRRLAIRLHDRAGNTGQSMPIGVDPSAPPELFGAPSVRDPREAALRGARIALTVRGGRAMNDGRGEATVVAVRIGRAVQVDGRLIDAAARPVAGAEIEARDARERTIGVGTTNATGQFAITLRPRMSGTVHVGVPVNDALLPTADSPVRVALRPRVTLRASARTVRAGGRAVLFTGRISPSPASLGVASKNVVLEWRDPLRGTWRPMINARADRAGRVRLSWAFGAGGFDVPIRLRLPREPGWSTEPGMSPVLTVHVK